MGAAINIAKISLKTPATPRILLKMAADTPTLTDMTVPDSPRVAGASSKKGKSLSQNAKRKSASLPSETVDYLKNWMMSPDHIAHPYPTEQEKTEIMKDTGIELKQLTNWFVNNRKRYWKPRVEARIQQQAHATTAAVQAHAAVAAAVHVAHQVREQQRHAATLALNAVTAAPLVNPVSPEAAFKPSQILQPCNNFVTFDLETSRTIHQLQQQMRQTSPPSSPVILTASALARHQEEPTVAFASVSETSSSSSVSDEGDVSDASSEESESVKRNDHVVAVPAATAGTPVATSRLQSYVNEAITNGARNVSFCSLEQFSGGSPVREEEASIKTVETPAPVPFPASTPRAPSKQPKKRTYHIVEDSPRAAKADSAAAPRRKFRRLSLEVWIDACTSASDNEDEGLPSLEEATRLFGYCN